METILEIKEILNEKPEGDWQSMDGYLVKTDKQDIKVLIDNHQSCCETWGYLTTNDNLEDFVGATLTEIKTVDESLNTEKYTTNRDYYEGGAIFVNFETSKGTMQLVVYNEHNGYYGHSVKIISEQLKLDDGV